MTSVAILPITDSSGSVVYRAIAGDRSATGQTAGEVLDALTAQLPSLTPAPLLLLQRFQGNSWFNTQQQNRLAALTEQWRHARDQDQLLASPETQELEDLVDAELNAAIARTQAWMANPERPLIRVIRR